MDKLDQLLDRLEAKSFEMSSYEMQHIEGQVAKYGKPAQRNRLNQLMSPVTNAHNKTVDAAQFDVVITRNTANIAQDLDYCVFGWLDSWNGYRNVISLSTGTTVQGAYGENNTQPNKYRFTYVNGANTDTVDVTCNQYPYPSFLTATASDVFRISKIRYSISNTVDIDQFNRKLNVVDRSMFGTINSNSISVNAYKSPDQFQTSIIDLQSEINITQTTCFNGAIKNVAGFSVTLSFFISKVVKWGKAAI